MKKNDYKLKGKLDEKYGRLTRMINHLIKMYLYPSSEIIHPLEG